ncbi:hypothetical protein [Clostridium estertheticum]|nr:hypothetical protein [Clostridium estertheticum]
MDITYSAPSAIEYISLRLKTGMGTKDLSKTEIALKHSLFLYGIMIS